MALDGTADFDARDRELLRAVLEAPEGDLRAFEELVNGHRKRIAADCRYLTRDEAWFEDLAQEVFVKAFFGLRSFEGRSSFRHWLQRIKVNHCLNHLAKQKDREKLSIDEDTAESYQQLQVAPVAEADLEQMVDRQRIDRILTSMPDTLRIPLIMCDMDELSYDEIAVSLGIGLSAVKMRIKRGREQFRRLYLSEDDSTARGVPA